MADKQVRAQYTQEFKLEAIRQVKAGAAIGVISRVLGIPKATLGNWVRQASRGELGYGRQPNRSRYTRTDGDHPAEG